MAAAVDEFTIWLGKKLQALNTDEGVFGSYITGILDGDETLEEKAEALEDILSEILVSVSLSSTFVDAVLLSYFLIYLSGI